MKRINYIKGDLIGSDCIFIKDLESKNNVRIAEFLCKCGNTFTNGIKYVKEGLVKSCGCLVRNNSKSVKYNLGDFINDTCSYVSEGEYIDSKYRKLIVKCICGNNFSAYMHMLRSNRTTSCGCRKSKLISNKLSTHGLTNSPEFISWTCMKSRCMENDKIHKTRYFDRGISICERWLNSFENFLEDMGQKLSPDMTLERIDNNKGYSKGNCRWATPKEQANNTIRNRIIEYEGISMNMCQWAEKLGIAQMTLKYRLNAGWDMKDALFKPVKTI